MEKIHLTKYGTIELLTVILISLLLISFVSAITFKQVYNPFTRQLDYYRNGNFSGENITVDFIFGNLTWINLYGYPSACPAGTFLTQLNDSVTCTAPVADDVDPGDFPAGNYSFDTNVLFVDSSSNRVGINTPTPQNTLNVVGDGNFTGSLFAGVNSRFGNQTTPAYWNIETQTVGGRLVPVLQAVAENAPHYGLIKGGLYITDPVLPQIVFGDHTLIPSAIIEYIVADDKLMFRGFTEIALQSTPMIGVGDITGSDVNINMGTGAMFAASDGTKFSQFGPDLAIFSGIDAVDTLVATRLESTDVNMRAFSAVSEYDGSVDLTTGIAFGLQGFFYHIGTGDFTGTGVPGEVGGRYAWRGRSVGAVVARGGGIASSATITNQATAMTLTEGYAFLAEGNSVVDASSSEFTTSYNFWGMPFGTKNAGSSLFDNMGFIQEELTQGEFTNVEFGVLGKGIMAFNLLVGTQPTEFINSNDTGHLDLNANTDIDFNIGGSELMVLSSSGNLTVGGNLSLEFGDLVSEQNPDGADAIRIKGTDYIDIVIGGMTGLFAVWNVADTTPIFYVNERGDTNIAGDLIVDTNTLFADAGNNRIGVLTTTPQNTLNVVGDGNFTGNLTIGDKLTFSFGEFIDNLVDGWLRITGNLNVTGNITSENVFIKQYIFPHTNATIPLLGANTWTNITFDQEVTDLKYGISHTFNDNTNQTFTINKSGIYNLEYDFDLIDTSAIASDIDAAGRVIFDNGTEILGSVFESDITKQQIETEISHNTLVRLSAGDKIIFQFVADDADVVVSTHSTFGDHPDSVTIIIEKISNLP